MKILIPLFIVLFLLGCNSTPNSSTSPKIKYIGVTKHPEKGRIISEFGKETTKNKYYDIDSIKCSNLTYQKGVYIGNEMTTDKGEIVAFLDSTSKLDAKKILIKGTGWNNGFTKQQDESLKVYNKFMTDRWACMNDIGWTSGLEEVLLDN